jgi:hypothetical protein
MIALLDPYQEFRHSRSSKYHTRIETRVILGPEAVAMKCYACDKTGHLARECPELKK